ncbi:hypothetical protein FRC00_000787 [Tulasnella sp. 408]|nr:hypothetical protein FRC00_000787 [Tulasnella sp. 408]
MSAVPATPSRSSAAAAARAELLASSPHYTTTKRHSLYGTEDRIIIDPGSRVWKVGFSGEGRPRDVFLVKHTSSSVPASASGVRDSIDEVEKERLMELELQDCLRSVFFNYRAPPTIIRAAAQPAAATRVPEEILTDALVEEVKTKCLFVGAPFDPATQPENDDAMDVDQPSSASTGTPSESGRSSRLSMSESQAPSSAASVSRASGSGMGSESSFSNPQESHLRAMAELYKRHATATDIQMRVVPPPAHAAAAGSFNNARGTLTIPGWIRERAAEVLFEGGDIDERSVVELILDSLLKVPVDLRKTLASSILVVGGTAMLPGFIQRLQAEIIKTLESQPHPPTSIFSPRRGGQSTPTPSASGANTPPDAVTPTAVRFQHRQTSIPSPRRAYDPYASLRSIGPHIAILNNPSVTNMAGHASPQALANAGKAPAFAPALMPWVGGSLAGALKISSEEVIREKWDEAYEIDQDAQRQELEDLAINTVTIEPETASPMKSPRKSQLRYRPPPAQPVGASIILEGGGLRPPAYSALPDWTRSPLGVGAPNVVWLGQQQSVPPV